MKKRIILISLLLFCGCVDKDGSDVYLPKTDFPKPCVKLYRNDAPKEWEIICSKGKFTDNTKITKDIIKPLEKVGFLCPGYRTPTADEINNICGN